LTVIVVAGQGQRLEINAKSGQKLSSAIWLSGQIAPAPLCGALGLCGRCRCRFLEDAPEYVPAERELFSDAELAAGWRLACRHAVSDRQVVHLELPVLKLCQHAAIHAMPPSCAAYLGVDLGTTSIQWQAADAAGLPLAQGSLWNPQAGAGADIVSRLQAAMTTEGRQRLSALVRRALAGILLELAASGIKAGRACIAANSAMTEILLERDISGLARAPYSLSFAGNETIALDMPDCPPLPTLFPPLPAPFVGGDISAGLLALLESGAKPPFLLADLGTNAELALLTEENRLFLASAPLGPALEGIGPQCGQPVGPGVITAFHAGPEGLVPQIMDGGEKCLGISATGYLSLLAILLNFRIMNSYGKLRAAAAMPIARKMAQGLSSGRLPLPCGQFLTSHDIEMLLKVKAALSVALEHVLAAAKAPQSGLTAIYLAGALGEYANRGDLAALGFIPQGLAAKAAACGNTSLKGACSLAITPSKSQKLEKLCKSAVIIDLADDPRFLDDYLAAMRWGSNAR